MRSCNGVAGRSLNVTSTFMIRCSRSGNDNSYAIGAWAKATDSAQIAHRSSTTRRRDRPTPAMLTHPRRSRGEQGENAEMDSLIAIDVPILPPRVVAEAAIALSAALPSSQSQGLRLDDTPLPHITLTQQFIPHTAVDDAAN